MEIINVTNFISVVKFEATLTVSNLKLQVVSEDFTVTVTDTVTGSCCYSSTPDSFADEGLQGMILVIYAARKCGVEFIGDYGTFVSHAKKQVMLDSITNEVRVKTAFPISKIQQYWRRQNF